MTGSQLNLPYGTKQKMHKIYARFYELGLTRELTNPRVGVIPSLLLDELFLCFSNIFYSGIN